jgi:hypothetical protein
MNFYFINGFYESQGFQQDIICPNPSCRTFYMNFTRSIMFEPIENKFELDLALGATRGCP